MTVTEGNPSKSITGYDPHSPSPSEVSLIFTLKQGNWVWTLPTNALLHFNCTEPQILLISQTECPTSLFALVWPWYKIHYFLSASVPSNSPSAAYEWYLTTDSCDPSSNAVLRFHSYTAITLVIRASSPKGHWVTSPDLCLSKLEKS